MNLKMMKKTVLTLSALLLSVTALADIHIENPRSRITAPTVKRGGAFMNIKNDGKTDDVLIAASTPRSSVTELHNTTLDENGVMKMREMENGIPSFTVQDSGIGIDSESLPHIFDRFFRADSSRTRGTGGSGLGLSIARWIVGRHGGRFDVLTRENLGTRITVCLPEQKS